VFSFQLSVFSVQLSVNTAVAALKDSTESLAVSPLIVGIPGSCRVIDKKPGLTALQNSTTSMHSFN